VPAVDIHSLSPRHEARHREPARRPNSETLRTDGKHTATPAGKAGVPNNACWGQGDGSPQITSRSPTRTRSRKCRWPGYPLSVIPWRPDAGGARRGPRSGGRCDRGRRGRRLAAEYLQNDRERPVNARWRRHRSTRSTLRIMVHPRQVGGILTRFVGISATPSTSPGRPGSR